MKHSLSRGVAVAASMAFALVGAMGLVGLSAAPALAANRVPPPIDHFYSIDCLALRSLGSAPDTVRSIDPATGNSTAVAPPVAGTEGCAYAAAWDPTHDVAYFEDAVFLSQPWIWQMDPTTGIASPVSQPTLNGAIVTIDGLAIEQDGTAYATRGNNFYRMSLDTGVLTLIGSLGQPGAFVRLAADSRTGAIWGLDFYNSNLYTIDPTTGVATVRANLADELDSQASSIQIDSSGTIWILVENLEADLWSFDPSAPDIAATGQRSSTLTVGGAEYYAYALFDMPDVAPTISPASATTTVGEPIAITLQATGWQHPTFSIVSGALPPGISLDPKTGVISGTTSHPGIFTITVQASNSAGTARAPFVLTVTAPSTGHKKLALTGTDVRVPAVVGASALFLGCILFVGAAVRRRRVAR